LTRLETFPVRSSTTSRQHPIIELLQPTGRASKGHYGRTPQREALGNGGFGLFQVAQDRRRRAGRIANGVAFDNFVIAQALRGEVFQPRRAGIGDDEIGAAVLGLFQAQAPYRHLFFQIAGDDEDGVAFAELRQVAAAPEADLGQRGRSAMGRRPGP